MRESGVLMPVFSLPSRFGIGCFSKEAYEFVDFLEKSGQGFWQILPVGPTGFGNSPYQPFSAFAGNPYFISPEGLIEDGYLTWGEVESLNFGNDETKVDYGALYENRFDMLKKASGKFFLQIKEDAQLKSDYDAFLEDESFWLEDYALYMALKDREQGKSWLDWPEELRTRDEKAMAEIKKDEEVSAAVDYICFCQFMFAVQWKKLRDYANKKNVKIIGDLPFYVSLDSADVWSNPKVFQMDKDLKPTVVAGCPPDAFSATGQLWGNPIYDWEALKKDKYDWWVRRIRRNYEFYDVIRIDHFHGFCDYYAVPYTDETAENGTLEKGPRMDLFDELKKQIEDLRIIAEDLGNTTPENEKLLADTGFPGMKVLQYGFTSWDSIYVNHRHTNNSVVYTGTHDNTPTRAWVEEINDGERDFTRRYVNSINTDYGQLVWDIIREAFRSVADLCIIPLCDYLCLGREARINSPGTAEGNWQWRLRKGMLSDDLAKSIRGLTEVYSRIPKPIESPDSAE